MRKLWLAGVLVLAMTAPAEASCRTVSIWQDGRLVVCTICTVGTWTNVTCS